MIDIAPMTRMNLGLVTRCGNLGMD